MKVVIPAGGWAPRGHQLKVWEALERGVRNVVVVAHRRWGKDELGMRWASVQAARRAANYFYMLPEAEHVRRAIWTSINAHTGVRRVEEAFPAGFREGGVKEQEMALATVTGSRVQFLGSDNYDSIVGAGPAGLVFSEWALADPQAFAMLRPILRENKGWALFLTTPRGKNHVWTMLQEMRGDPEWAVFVESAEETGVYTAAERAAEERQLKALYGPEVGASLYRQEYLCSFEDIFPGSLYGDLMEQAEREGRVTALAPPAPGEPVYAAFDLGYSDATAIWYAQVRSDGWVDIIAYEEFRRKSIPDICHILKAHPWQYGGLLLPHDAAAHEISSGQTVEGVFLRLGFATALMPRTDEHAQVQSVRLMLPQCRFQEDMTERGISCLKAYSLKRLEDRNDWSFKAIHNWASHGSKAMATLAYFASSLRSGPQGAKSVISLRPEARQGADRSRLGWMG